MLRRSPYAETCRLPFPALTMAVGMALGACGDASPPAPTATVRDSAGITVVENGVRPQETLWTLSAEPTLDLGSLDGPSETQFFRVSDAMRLADGRLAVVDGGSSSVRIFSEDGSHLDTWGRKGQGPGEFENPGQIMPWTGDSVGVWDRRLRRLTVFDDQGVFGRTQPVTEVEGMDFPTFAHRLEGGELVVYSRLFLAPGEAGEQTRAPMKVTVLSPDGSVAADLGEHPGREVLVRFSGDRVDMFTIPFSRNEVLRPGRGDETLIAATDRLEFMLYGTDGTLRRLVRLNEPTRPVTDALLQAVVEARVAAAPEEEEARIRQSYEDLPVPDSLPAFADARVDALGYLWVQPYRLVTDTGSDAWLVVDPQGTALGTVTVPGDVTVYEVGEDYVVGKWRDEMEIEHVRVWSLDRSPGLP